MSRSKKGSYLFDKKGGGICSLSYVHYEINILDFMMHLQSIQKYQNQSSKPQELVYRFFVNETTTIYSIEIELFEPKSGAKKRMKAKIFERKEAQEKYDDAIAQGHTAMLMEEEEGKKDIIELNLGNIYVGWQVTIWMKEVQEIEIEKTPDLNNSNTMRIMLPSMNYYGGGSNNSNLKGNVSMDIHVEVKKGNIHKITSPTHEKSLEIIEKQEKEVKLKTKEMIALSTDFVLYITTVENTKIGLCIIENDKLTKDNDSIFRYSAAISIIPHLPPEPVEEIMTNIIFVLDCSGSMSGGRMWNATKALENSIEIMSQKHLKKIKTNIVKFGSSVQHMYPKSVELNDKNKKEILNYIRNCSADMGGTNIKDALIFALQEFDVDDEYTKQIVFLTDGEDHRADEIIQYVKKKGLDTRIFSIGIGRWINPVFLNQLAYATNGQTIFLNDSEDMSKKVTEQFKFILQKSVTSVDVKFEEGVQSKCVLKHIPPIYNFQKYSLYYFLDKMPEEESVVISYVCGQKKFTENIDIIKNIVIQQQQKEEEEKEEENEGEEEVNKEEEKVEEVKEEENEEEEKSKEEEEEKEEEVKEEKEVKEEEKEEEKEEKEERKEEEKVEEESEGEKEEKKVKEEEEKGEEEEDKEESKGEEASKEEKDENNNKNFVSILSAKRRVLEIEGFFLPEVESDNDSNRHDYDKETASEKVKKLKDEIISLSKKYQFLSSLTSFLLISVNEDPIWEALEKKEFTQMVKAEEEERKRQEEERKIREEEERKRREEERKRQEEERKRQQEEWKRQEEEWEKNREEREKREEEEWKEWEKNREEREKRELEEWKRSEDKKKKSREELERGWKEAAEEERKIRETGLRSKGTCYCMNSEVFVKVYQSTVHNKLKKKKMYEIEVGDFVQSFDSDGKIVFQEVFEIHKPSLLMNRDDNDNNNSAPQRIEILNILCDNGKYLKVTFNHYLYVCEQKCDDSIDEIINNYIMKAAGVIRKGDYLLYQSENDEVPEQVEVISVSSEVCFLKHVLNPFVLNCRMIVNGFYTSTLTGDHMKENSQFVRLECPISVKNSKEQVFSPFWG